ncbi:hypothetical protein Pan97_37400 [Bremerella volcania]|uniref:Uncharacterized protein n=1 Tax=Bremerella volcania TaxID=2527984 RepID=A0A518CBS5_9BACT|nr:hypothetical protein [Bremerella volcania]QDU76685.1 hypothetical protein Pan97_37400 [Bremerella volcania]
MSHFFNDDVKNNSTYISLPQSEVDDLDDVGCDLNASDWDMSPLDDHQSQTPMQSMGSPQGSLQVDANDVATNLASNNDDMPTGSDFVAPSTQNLSVNATTDPNGNGASISLLSNSNEHKSVDDTIDLNSDNLNGNGPASSNLNMNGLGNNQANRHGTLPQNASAPSLDTPLPSPSVSQFQLSKDAGKRAKKYKEVALILNGYSMPTARSLDRLNQCYLQNDAETVNNLFDFKRAGGTTDTQKKMARAAILGMIAQGSPLDEISAARDAMVAAFNDGDSADKENVAKAIKEILFEAGNSNVNILMNLREDPRLPQLGPTAFAGSNRLIRQHEKLESQLENLWMDYREHQRDQSNEVASIKSNAIGRIFEQSAPLDRAHADLRDFLGSVNNNNQALPVPVRNALARFDNELNGLSNEQKDVLKYCSGDQGAQAGRDSAFPNLLGLCVFLEHKRNQLDLPHNFFQAAGEVYNALTNNQADRDARLQDTVERYANTHRGQVFRNGLAQEMAPELHKLQQESIQMHTQVQAKDQQIRNQMNDVENRFTGVRARENATLFGQGGTLSPYSNVFNDIVGNGSNAGNRNITEGLQAIIPFLRARNESRVMLVDRLSRLDSTEKQRLNQLWQLPNFRAVDASVNQEERKSNIRSILAAHILSTQPKNANGGISDQSFQALEKLEVSLGGLNIAHLQVEIEKLNR